MKARQPILGVIAPDRKRMTPSQKTMLARAGTILSPGAQAHAAKRARKADEIQKERDGR